MARTALVLRIMSSVTGHPHIFEYGTGQDGTFKVYAGGLVC